MEATFDAIQLPPELAAEAPGGQNTRAGDPIFSNYGDNWLKFRVRSHPDVAANPPPRPRRSLRLIGACDPPRVWSGTVSERRMGLFKKRADPAEMEAIKADIAAMAARLDQADADKAELGARGPAADVAARDPDSTPPSEPPPSLPSPVEPKPPITEADLDILRARLQRLSDRLEQVDARITSISTELANQLTELSGDVESIARSIQPTPDDVVERDPRRAGALASEQARYQIAFREDLADLAERLRRAVALDVTPQSAASRASIAAATLARASVDRRLVAAEITVAQVLLGLREQLLCLVEQLERVVPTPVRVTCRVVGVDCSSLVSVGRRLRRRSSSRPARRWSATRCRRRVGDAVADRHVESGEQLGDSASLEIGRRSRHCCRSTRSRTGTRSRRLDDHVHGPDVQQSRRRPAPAAGRRTSTLRARLLVGLQRQARADLLLRLGLVGDAQRPGRERVLLDHVAHELRRRSRDRWTR